MKKKSRFTIAIAVLLSMLLVLPMLSGCTSLFGGAPTSGTASTQTGNEAETAAREATVNEGKVNRYFASIVDDPVALATFLSQMPKGANLRVLPSYISYPSMVGSGLPLTESEYRNIVVRAILEHIGYLEIVVNLTPAQISSYDDLAEQIAQEYTDLEDGFEVKINYLAAVSGDLSGTDFEREFRAAMDLYRSSDRIVGIVVLPATTVNGFASFYTQMLTIEAINLGESILQSVLGNEDADAQSADATSEGTSEEASSSDPSISETVVPEEFPLVVVSIRDLSSSYVGYESMVGRITTALRFGHASRIDFAETIVYEANAFKMIEGMVTDGVSVTIVPRPQASIFPAQGVNDGSAYRLFSSAGVKIALVSGESRDAYLDLQSSYAQIAFAHNLSYREVKALAYSAIDASFLTSDERADQRTKLDASFLEFEKTMAGSIDALNLLR